MGKVKELLPADSLEKILQGAQKSGEISRKRKLERKAEYDLSPNRCKECSFPLDYEDRHNKFCSRSCGATHHNRKVKKPEHPCKVCGIAVRYDRTYCSKECQKLDPESFYHFDIEGWLRGEIEGGTGTNSLGGCRSAVRRYLLEEANHKCSKCGWCEVHPITDKVPLEINHIDGDAFNNVRSNLEVLCPNCHSLTPNFRGLNKKSSRTHRQ
jgi:predicted nucleic acid-binding Zn ribbon protein